MSRLFDLLSDLRSTTAQLSTLATQHAALVSALDPTQPDPTPPALLRHLTEEIRANLAHPDLQTFIPQPDSIRTLVRTREHPAEHLPQRLVDLYELLYIEAYGSDSVYIGNPDTIHGTGKAQRGRTSSDQVETRGGAVQKKKLSASQTSVIKNERAYRQKDLVDKKLRHVARDIANFLKGAPPKRNTYNCPNCHLIVTRTANYCLQCGVALRATTHTPSQNASEAP